MKVAETRTSRRTCGVTRSERIENEFIRENLGVTDVPGKIRLRRF